jgi:two-component system NarL family sensor kinase
MQKSSYDIVIFLVAVSLLIILMIAFIVGMLYLYRKKQLGFEKNIEQIKQDNEKMLLKAKLEMQEQTFQDISREIHDNISLSLTLAKLHLNTFAWNEKEKSTEKVNTSIELLSKSIEELSDISKSLNADIIIQQGLLGAIEDELHRIRRANQFTISYELSGTPIYLDSKKELIIFRIIQEAFNNIIKHAGASHTTLALHYNPVNLAITLADDGRGFLANLVTLNNEAGLKNMESRIKMLNGNMKISSLPGKGTTLLFTVPIK